MKIEKKLDVPSSPKQACSTRKNIEEQATTFFSEKGYDATSVREIAEACGVSKPVVYYYFKNKGDLCHHLISTGLEEFRGLIRGVVENGRENGREDGKTGAFEHLVEMVQAHFDFCEANVDFVRFIYAISFGPDRKKISYDFYAYDAEMFELRLLAFGRASKEGLINEGREGDAVRYIQGIISTYVMYRVDGHGDFPSGLSRTIVSDLVNGLGTSDAGQKSPASRG